MAHLLLYVSSGLTFKNTTLFPQSVMFCTDQRTNSDYPSILRKLTGFCSRDGECLLRGMDWIFQNNSS